MELTNYSEIFIWLSTLKFESPLFMLTGLLALSLLPALVLGLTCFVKVSVVMAALRSALGGSGIPSQAVSSFLALILSLRMLLPLAAEFESQIAEQPVRATSDLEVISQIFDGLRRVISSHLIANTDMKKRQFFILLKNPEADFANCPAGEVCKVNGEDFFDLLTSYLVSELTEAFQIAVVLFLPFIVIDLVVASLLAGMGMIMVSPANIALPIKLGVFVLAEGWLNLSTLILGGYGS